MGHEGSAARYNSAADTDNTGPNIPRLMLVSSSVVVWCRRGRCVFVMLIFDGRRAGEERLGIGII